METSRKAGNLEALAVELPEDIARLKAYGDFRRAEQVIERRLEKDIPQIMRERLLFEKEIMAQLPAQYPYSETKALELLQQTFRDFTEEEMEALLIDGAFEWIYLDGVKHFKDNFIANLIKTRPNLAERVLDESQIAGKNDGVLLLNQVIARMKSQTSVHCRFRIRSTVKLHPDMQRPGKRIQVQLPLPIEYSQVKSFRLLSHSPESAKVAPADSMQRTICFEGIYQAGQEFSVEYEFETEMRYWDWKKAVEERADGGATTVKTPAGATTGELAGMQEEQLPHIRFTPYLQSLTAEVIGDETDPLLRAKKIYDYITSHVMYSFVRSYFTIPQQVTFIGTGLKGDCGLQALLFITMCRIAGVPARWQSGLYTTPLTIGNHDWAQFYIEPYGWLYADCSFGGSAYRAGAGERREFYFGNLEPYRLPAAREYQQDFCFPKQYLRRDPFDNQRGEAEYEDMGLLCGVDFDTVHEMVEIAEW